MSREEQTTNVNNLQSPALQIPLLNRSLDLTLSQYALQDRILVLFPSPHVLLQDDHVVHEVYSGGPEKTVFLLPSAFDKCIGTMQNRLLKLDTFFICLLYGILKIGIGGGVNRF